MKTRHTTTITAITALVLMAGSAVAGTLTKREVRKFKGVYLGEVSGIAGNTGSVPSNFFTLDAAVKVKGASRQLVPPLMSGLHSQSAHRLVFRKPTGSVRRAKFFGFYVGTAINPTTSLPEAISGTRAVIIADRGRGVNFRFVMRLSDDLREGSFSAQDFKGVLRKER